MQEKRHDIYEYFGTYPNDDARKLLDVFVSSEINYTLDVDKLGIETMSAFQASKGGTFGTGAGIAIGVHIDDLEAAMALRQKVLKIIV